MQKIFKYLFGRAQVKSGMEGIMKSMLKQIFFKRHFRGGKESNFREWLNYNNRRSAKSRGTHWRSGGGLTLERFNKDAHFKLATLGTSIHIDQ